MVETFNTLEEIARNGDKPEIFQKKKQVEILENSDIFQQIAKNDWKT